VATRVREPDGVLLHPHFDAAAANGSMPRFPDGDISDTVAIAAEYRDSI